MNRKPDSDPPQLEGRAGRVYEESDAVGTELDLPCLMLTAEWDFAIRPEFAAGMPAVIEDLEIEMIPRSGHWVQQESPNLVNRHLVGWLTDRFGP